MAAKTLQIIEPHHLQPIQEELIANGNMELDSNWNDYRSPPINEISTEQVYSGASSRKFTVDIEHEGIKSDTFTTITGRTYTFGAWVYPKDDTYTRIGFRKGDNSGWALIRIYSVIQDSWNYVSGSYIETAGGSGAWIHIESTTGDATGTWYVDNVSVAPAKVELGLKTNLLVKDSHIEQRVYYPELSDSGGIHQNTIAVTYDFEPYLKCRHLHGLLTGSYTSPITDIGSVVRYLVYLIAKIAVTGVGNTWADQFPAPVKWNSVDVENITWAQLFDLDAAPNVNIELYYGDTSPPANSVGRLEILSTIVSARYWQIKITITDPTNEVHALVENYELKFCD